MAATAFQVQAVQRRIRGQVVMLLACTIIRRRRPWCCALPERRSHDYIRHGITSLFAAFNIADGTVISEIHRRHRAVSSRSSWSPSTRPSPPNWTSIWSATTSPPTRPCHPRLAAATPSLPPAFHPDRIVLDRPGRTMVRVPHRPDDPAQRPQKRCRTGKRRPNLDRQLDPRLQTLGLAQDRGGDPRFPHQIYGEDFQTGTIAQPSTYGYRLVRTECDRSISFGRSGRCPQ
jgi:hypothetical protein